MEADIPNARVFPLQAPDGTRLKERMIKDGRYVDWDADSSIPIQEKSNFNTFTIIPKQLTVKQLRQGSLWLIWELYKPQNVSDRLKTFFEIFEKSHKKDKLEIPKLRLNKKVLGLIWRVFKYYLFKALPDEKMAIRKMVGYARNSSLPSRFSMVLTAFLNMKNTQGMIRTEEPQIDQISYPK